MTGDGRIPFPGASHFVGKVIVVVITVLCLQLFEFRRGTRNPSQVYECSDKNKIIQKIGKKKIEFQQTRVYSQEHNYSATTVTTTTPASSAPPTASASATPTTPYTNNIPSPTASVEAVPNDNTAPLLVFDDDDASSDPCFGKERVMQILESSGMAHADVQSQCHELPTWEFLTKMYGDEPVILGLDTCKKYRKSMKPKKLKSRKLGGIQVDGLFNVGSNAMAHTLLHNLDEGKWFRPDLDMYDPLYWEKLDCNVNGVSWGKHALLKYRPAKPYKSLPLSIVRDPYSWMQSMCKAWYRSSWNRKFDLCPNLVISPQYRRKFSNNTTTYEVTVKKTEREPNITDTLPSLSDYWSRFYGDYVSARFPRVIIRFEDTILFGQEIIEALSNCTGSPRKIPYEHFLPTAKSHGKSSGLLAAIKKLGRNRTYHMTDLDVQYAKRTLRADLMELFHYRYDPGRSEQ